jgi:hypothetical protein
MGSIIGRRQVLGCLLLLIANLVEIKTTNLSSVVTAETRDIASVNAGVTATFSSAITSCKQ